MRTLLKAIFLFLLPLTSLAQKTVLPGNSEVNTSRLKPGTSLYTIYYVKGTTWTKKGTYTNEISINGNELKFVVDFKDDKGVWYKKATSVADAKTLSPINFKFEGLKRNYDLKFGTPVTGKLKLPNGGKEKQISVQPTKKYIDYNMAEIFFTTLPLETGYKALVPEFYYVDNPDSLVSNYIIKDVKSYIHRSPKTGNHESWLVSVLEEESGATYIYIIDKKDYRIWQREMPAGNGIMEICVNEELDYQPIKSKFNKELSMQMLEKGNSVITGTAFARDHNSNNRLQVINLKRAQYAPKGTVVTIMPNSAYIEEWKDVNKKIRRGKKLPEVPLDANVASCIKQTKVYDDKGHFEFTNLMAGEYILFTSFGYTHQYSYQYYAGQSNVVHVASGQVLSSSPVYGSANASTGATAEIETKVTIKKDGDKVDINLKDTR